MESNDAEYIHWIHTAWSAVLTAFGALVVGAWNRFNKQLDEKVDKSEVKQLRDDLQARAEAQDKMHSENRRRLDAIYKLLARRARGQGRGGT